MAQEQQPTPAGGLTAGIRYKIVLRGYPYHDPRIGTFVGLTKENGKIKFAVFNNLNGEYPLLNLTLPPELYDFYTIPAGGQRRRRSNRRSGRRSTHRRRR
jgi:hypothetical protein